LHVIRTNNKEYSVCTLSRLQELNVGKLVNCNLEQDISPPNTRAGISILVLADSLFCSASLGNCPQQSYLVYCWPIKIPLVLQVDKI
jgi:hypothetical protein